MENSRRDNSHVSPSEACKIRASMDDNTAVKGAEGYKLSLKSPTESIPKFRPIKERKMADK